MQENRPESTSKSKYCSKELCCPESIYQSHKIESTPVQNQAGSDGVRKVFLYTLVISQSFCNKQFTFMVRNNCLEKENKMFQEGFYHLVLELFLTNVQVSLHYSRLIC